jgi:hypothetical protein
MRWLYAELSSVQSDSAAASESTANSGSSALPEQASQHAPAMPVAAEVGTSTEHAEQGHPSEAGKPLLKQQGSRQPLFERTLSGKYRVRGRWQLHMFVSQPPCGDACIFADQAATGTGSGCENSMATSWRRTGAKRLKAAELEAAEAGQVAEPSCGTVSGGQRRGSEQLDREQGRLAHDTCDAAASDDQKQDAGDAMSVQREGERQAEGVLRRKPGRGDPTRSLSCRHALQCQELLLSRALLKLGSALCYPKCSGKYS